MLIMREPMKDYSLSFKKDLLWGSGKSGSIRSCSTDGASLSSCGSFRSFADEEVVEKKKVRFAPMSRQRKVSSHKCLSVSKKSAIWYSKTDAEHIRSNAKRAAIRACVSDTKYSDALNRVCREIIDLLEDAANDAGMDWLLTDDDKFLASMADKLYRALRRDDTSTLRGLEDLISQGRCLIRFDMGEDARDIVIETSKQHKTQEEMARRYKSRSMASAVFAHITALADEAAVHGRK